MSVNSLGRVTTLTFDMFGTVLDLSGCLIPPLDRFLSGKATSLDGAALWPRWRARQRYEQFQDSLLMVGHCGYQESCRRALVYSLRNNGIEFDDDEIRNIMKAYQDLTPFEDAVQGLKRLGGHYRLVALSNGEPDFLHHLVENRIKVHFDAIISVEEARAFKPHPSVYRTAVRILEVEPQQIMMVAAHAFDIAGARACGFRGAFVNRYGVPFDETPYQPDFTVNDFNELAARLVSSP